MNTIHSCPSVIIKDSAVHFSPGELIALKYTASLHQTMNQGVESVRQKERERERVRERECFQ